MLRALMLLNKKVEALKKLLFRKANMKIFLLGLMGSGKSFWAERLSAILDIPCFDLDTEIEKKEKKTVTEIFQTQGEEAFRIKEADALRTFSNKETFILSTGGGTPCFHGNMQWMNEQGITIWIDEPLDTIEKRLKKQKLHRPLIASVPQPELKEFLSQMLNKRSEFYTQAKFRLREHEVAEKNFLKILSQ